MPPLVITEAGLSEMLIRKLQLVGGNWTLRLFRNDYTPDINSVRGDFVEADFAGYNSRDLLPANWQAPTFDSPHAISLYGTEPLNWTNTGAVLHYVYGYWVELELGGTVIFAQRFDLERPISAGAIFYLRPEMSEATDPLP